MAAFSRVTSALSLLLLTTAAACSAGGGTAGNDDDGDESANTAAGGSATGEANTGGTTMTTGPVNSGGTSATGGATAGGGTAMGTGGTSPVESCTPNPTGTLVINGDVVLDEVTCLTWMLGGETGTAIKDLDTEHDFSSGTYWDAEMWCSMSNLGGYTDWRVPTVDEFNTIRPECLNWSAPNYPWSIAFDDPDLSIWTATPVGGDKYCLLDLMGGGVATSGVSSGPGVRCVRGTGTGIGTGASCSGCPL